MNRTNNDKLGPEAFKDALKNGRCQRLEEWLALHDLSNVPDARLLDLVLVEYRHAKSDSDDRAHYFERFPALRDQLHRFFESESSSRPQSNNSVAPNGTAIEPTPVPFDQIRDACGEFSGDWEKGGRPNLPSYVFKVAKDDQATLLRNLLEYEVQKRRESGESPRADEYIEQLPDHAAVIRQVFLETSTGSFSGNSIADTKEYQQEGLPATRLGDFRLVRELGRGGMGAVYEAVHMTKGHRVALKTLPAVTPEALHRFKREFRLAAELSHPNLVGLHTLENDGEQYFITMELVSGVDFRTWVRPANRLNEQRLRSALPQLVAGVMGLHAQGVIHRDLKPQNVLVTPVGRLIILDFGLVAELTGAAGSLANVAGTPPYMAPEQAAGKSVGPPADWYAIGVMLYNALSGKLPFHSIDVWKLLEEKQRQDAPPLPDDSEIPDDLADLCMQLLSRSPKDRPDPMAIAGAVHTSETTTTVRGTSSGELVGRETQLAALAEAKYASSRTGEPTLVFISGRSGEGKTSLAEQFLAPIREIRWFCRDAAMTANPSPSRPWTRWSMH